MVAIGALVVALLTWLWHKTQSVTPEGHARIDMALRELRSLDRTVNQDVLRARYQLINSWHPVLNSYRRIEQLEAVLATPPSYLDREARRQMSAEVALYRAAVTRKQAHIERFKYRTADLRASLRYLPSAGTEAAKAAADMGDRKLASDIIQVLQHTLIYNLTSDESYAPTIRRELDELTKRIDQIESIREKRRVRNFALQVRTLLRLKPEVDALLQAIFMEPVTQHEDTVAAAYYKGYASAERVAGHYRVGLYGLCLALFVTVGLGVRRLQQSARALASANERLEERVVERTRELASRNREMRAVLDNVNQALFTVGLDGSLSRERSRALDEWFPDAEPGRTLWSVLAPLDPKAAAWIEMGWDDLKDSVMPCEVVLDQLPSAIDDGERHYALEYRPIRDGAALEKIMLVVSDVTERVRREQREAEQQEQLVIFQHVTRDRTGFGEFFAEAQRLVDSVLGGEHADYASEMRAVHTLKGNCALYGVTTVASTCHELESKLVDTKGRLNDAERARLADTWSAFASKVRALTGRANEQRVELSSTELRTLREAIHSGTSSAELLLLLREVELEPAERRLARLSEQAKSLAKRLGKGEIVVTTESNHVRLEPERWAAFWAAFVHMLRNAIDHGIEPAEERLRAGKPPQGQLWLRTRLAGGDVVVEIADDGRGIDWEALRQKAQDRGLPASTDAELLDLLFRGGLSTKESVTEFSGRGTGLSASRNACLALGGSISVTTEPGRGTTFSFRIPDEDAPASRVTFAA